MKILLDENKPFFKANLHMHSYMSDGKYSPKEIKEQYKKHGYSIVAFTDHEHIIDNSHLNDEDFLAITGCELAVKENEKLSAVTNHFMKVAHFNAYALDPHNTKTPCHAAVYERFFINDNCRHLLTESGEYQRAYGAQAINKMIADIKAQGFIVSYNHPGWSLENANDYMNYEGMFAVEIYNHSCVQMGFGDDEHVFDDLLRAGKQVYCTACDDAHVKTGFDSPDSDTFGGWVCINAEKLEYDSIMNALQNGDFYASTGPEILSLTVEGNTVRVKCSAAASITLITAARYRKTAFAEKGETITEAEFALDSMDKSFRIRINDEHGKHAYSQSYLI